MTPTERPETETPEPDDLDARLDEALDESFPASDPIAVHRPEELS